jgi:phosphoserine phosphatase
MIPAFMRTSAPARQRFLGLPWIAIVLMSLGCATAQTRTATSDYPEHWWQPIAHAQKASWEIGPDEAGPGEVILSKRNELGLLSNFAATPFVLDGVRYASVEGFWQMMKYPEGDDDPRQNAGPFTFTREAVAQMVAFDAKSAGKEAGTLLKKAGIGWISYRGKRLDYKGADSDAHYALIRRAMAAKLAQNPRVHWLLLSTVDLKLRPDHHQSPHRTRAYEYHRIWMDLRAIERAKDVAFIEKALSHWSPTTRARLHRAILRAGAAETPVALFDGDGTLWHADIPREFLTESIRARRLLHFPYDAAKTPEEAAARLYDTCKHDVSICIAQAAYLYTGLTLAKLEQDMDGFFQGFEAKTFPAQRQLIALLRKRRFQIFVVSGGPRWLAQAAAKRFYDIPPERVIGVQTHIVNGVLSAEVIPPLPFRKGKAAAVATWVQRPVHIAVGNSGSDVPMLALARHAAVAVQSFGSDHPGFHYRSEQKLAAEATKRGWLVETLKPTGAKKTGP